LALGTTGERTPATCLLLKVLAETEAAATERARTTLVNCILKRKRGLKREWLRKLGRERREEREQSLVRESD